MRSIPNLKLQDPYLQLHHYLLVSEHCSFLFKFHYFIIPGLQLILKNLQLRRYVMKTVILDDRRASRRRLLGNSQAMKEKA